MSMEKDELSIDQMIQDMGLDVENFDPNLAKNESEKDDDKLKKAENETKSLGEILSDTITGGEEKTLNRKLNDLVDETLNKTLEHISENQMEKKLAHEAFLLAFDENQSAKQLLVSNKISPKIVKDLANKSKHGDAILFGENGLYRGNVTDRKNIESFFRNINLNGKTQFLDPKIKRKKGEEEKLTIEKYKEQLSKVLKKYNDEQLTNSLKTTFGENTKSEVKKDFLNYTIGQTINDYNEKIRDFEKSNFIDGDCIEFCLEKDIAQQFNNVAKLNEFSLITGEIKDWVSVQQSQNKNLENLSQLQKDSYLKLNNFFEQFKNLEKHQTLVCVVVFKDQNDPKDKGQHFTLLSFRKINEQIKLLYVDTFGNTEDFGTFIQNKFYQCYNQTAQSKNWPILQAPMIYCENYQGMNECGIQVWRNALLSCALSNENFHINGLKEKIDANKLRFPQITSFWRYQMAIRLKNDIDFFHCSGVEQVIIEPKFENENKNYKTVEDVPGNHQHVDLDEPDEFGESFDQIFNEIEISINKEDKNNNHIKLNSNPIN